MESLACSVLQRNVQRFKASNVDPVRFAWKLRETGVITDADVQRACSENSSASERWGYLLSTIMKKSTEGIFQQFVDVVLKDRQLKDLGKGMKDTYLQGGGVWMKEPYQVTGQAAGGAVWTKKIGPSTERHFSSKSRSNLPVWDIARKNREEDLKKPNPFITMKDPTHNTMNQHSPEEDKKGLLSNVAEVTRTVISWNNSPDMLHFQEWLDHLGSIRQNVAKLSLSPQVWPTAYLSQPALQRFLMLVVEKCIQHSSTECMPTAEMRISLKSIVEPIDLDTVEDVRFKKHISQWVYSTECSPLPMEHENLLSLRRYFQHGLDGESQKNEPLAAIQQDVRSDITEALAKVVCCFTNHFKRTDQRYHESFVLTMVIPFNYDPDQQVFLTSFSVDDLSYLCAKFDHCCEEFSEVIQQKSVVESQAYLFSLALELHDHQSSTESQVMAHMKCIEQKIGPEIHPQITEILFQLPSKSYDWKWFQAQLQSAASNLQRMKSPPVKPTRKQQCEDFLSVLGLKDLYPQKLKLSHALEIREDTLESVKHLQGTGSSTVHHKGQTRKEQNPIQCMDPKLYPFLILQKIMAFDCKCRTKLVLDSTLYSSFIKIISMHQKNTAKLVVHPMDGLLAVLHCTDDFLRQDLMSRLATCQLAVPFLLPDLFEPHIVTFPIWAMRSIVKEWQLSDGTSKEGRLISYPSPLVSFLRIGKFKVSKSHIMNAIISESGHNIFFHYNCNGGSAKRLFIKGLVEVCWYLPSKSYTAFSDVVTFANLHGDARECPKQVKFLSKVSFMNFVFISEDHLNDESLEVLKHLAAAPGGLVLLQVEPSDDDETWHQRLKPLTGVVQTITLVEKNEADISEEVREEIKDKIIEKWNDIAKHSSLEEQSESARLCSILVDEDEEYCLKGKELAIAFEQIVTKFRDTQGAENLKNVLSLQGHDLWQEWAATEKEQFRQTLRGQCEVEVYAQQQRNKMENIRKKQFSRSQFRHPLMMSFLTSFLTREKKTRYYFLQWIRLFLDDLAREKIPLLHTQYKKKVTQLGNIQSQKRKDEGAEKACKAEIQMLNKQIVGASFGIEHLLREVSQIYETLAAQKQVPKKDDHVLHLPEVAAELMIEGYPLELMDGDAAHVPISWVSVVLSKIQELLGNARLFVLSVLGVQSSGKSTLLNTVFGVQFTASAGRCTRGAFMQLLPIHSSLRQECKCDYFLIVDTEGLRAPEFAEQTLKHDNELATFVIGLANVTIINLSGETMGDMDDILQTAVHAFLRMKTVELRPSCHFVHQNVTAVTAGEKTMMGHLRFKEALDLKTKAAAKEEGLEDQYKHFTDVINFNSEKHVFHFQNLWKGDPPMAPINPGYSTNAQFLKLCLIFHAKQSYSIHLKVFQMHLKELWKSILHENFVFSFKNTLEVTAYNTLDSAYSKWSWEFKQEMMTWEHKASNRMKSCKMCALPSVYSECCSELPKFVQDIHQKLEEKMNAFFEESSQQEILVKWKGETEARLTSLTRQLKQHAENHCKLLKGNQETLAKVDKMKEDYITLILSNVKQCVSQLKRGKLNDTQLEERFNGIWIQCIDKIKHLPVHIEEVNVKTEVQNCLTGFEPLRPALPRVLQKLQCTPLEKTSNLRLVVTNVHVKARPVYTLKFFRRGSEFPTKEGQDIADMLLEHQREYLQQMKRKHYNPNLATDLLHTLFKGIASHSTDITFTEEYRVDMALTTCGYALREFQKMVETERKTNDPVEYLERKMRGPFLNIFKDEYNQIAQEITAASGVCDLLLHSVKKEVFASLSPRIADGMKGAYDFLQSKPALKAKILNDIGENLYENRGGSFLICLHYLRSVDRSIHWWLKRYTLQYCEDQFARITSKEISRIVVRIREEVSNVSERFHVQGMILKS